MKKKKLNAELRPCVKYEVDVPWKPSLNSPTASVEAKQQTVKKKPH